MCNDWTLNTAFGFVLLWLPSYDPFVYSFFLWVWSNDFQRTVLSSVIPNRDALVACHSCLPFWELYSFLEALEHQSPGILQKEENTEWGWITNILFLSLPTPVCICWWYVLQKSFHLRTVPTDFVVLNVKLCYWKKWAVYFKNLIFSFSDVLSKWSHEIFKFHFSFKTPNLGESPQCWAYSCVSITNHAFSLWRLWNAM